MLSFKYAELKKPSIGGAIRKLRDAAGLPPKVAYSIIKIVRWLEQEEKTAQSLLEKFTKELAEKNEDGSLKTPEGGEPGTLSISPENQEVWKKKEAEWASIEVSMDWQKLKASELGAAKLTPAELAACEWFIDIEDLNA